MKTSMMVLLLVAAVAWLTGPVLAAEPSTYKVSRLKLDQEPGGSGKAAAGGDAQMDLRKQDFVKFARAKLQEMNRNHRLSRSRMGISKNPDGTCRAEYRQIDDASMACEVNPSKSKSVPYVAVLSYKEEIFTASCPNPEACRRAEFTPTGYIPNRHIFSYKQGRWQ